MSINASIVLVEDVVGRLDTILQEEGLSDDTRTELELLVGNLTAVVTDLGEVHEYIESVLDNVDSLINDVAGYIQNEREANV